MVKPIFVKCPDCGLVIRTKKDDVCQCPKGSDGCGKRFNVKENLLKA